VNIYSTGISHHQGQHPDKATIFFVGRDANFPAGFQEENHDYFNDFDSWLDARANDGEFVHHPLLLARGKHPAGRKYHEVARSIFKEAAKNNVDVWKEVVKSVCFLEMLGVRTLEQPKRGGIIRNIRSDENQKHLRALQNSWFREGAITITFVHKGACTLMREKLSDEFGRTLMNLYDVPEFKDLPTNSQSAFATTHLSMCCSRDMQSQIARTISEHLRLKSIKKMERGSA
jgi:hypothetical protein